MQDEFEADAAAGHLSADTPDGAKYSGSAYASVGDVPARKVTVCASTGCNAASANGAAAVSPSARRREQYIRFTTLPAVGVLRKSGKRAARFRGFLEVGASTWGRRVSGCLARLAAP